MVNFTSPQSYLVVIICGTARVEIIFILFFIRNYNSTPYILFTACQKYKILTGQVDDKTGAYRSNYSWLSCQHKLCNKTTHCSHVN